MTSTRISTQAACSCSAAPCCSILLSRPLPPRVRMMTPTVISQASAPDTAHRRESLFFFFFCWLVVFFFAPQRWFVLWLLHCCLRGALVLWQTERFSHSRKCGGGALIDSPVRNAKLAPVPIWSQLSSGTHRPCPPAYWDHTEVDLGLGALGWLWQWPGLTVEIT